LTHPNSVILSEAIAHFAIAQSKDPEASHRPRPPGPFSPNPLFRLTPGTRMLKSD
jgi:hypothetical protein